MPLPNRSIAAAKAFALGLASQFGVTPLIQNSRWRRARLLILCYHGVSLADEHEWSDLYVSGGHLRRRFAHLRDAGYQVVPLGEGLVAMQQGTLPPRSVALTFDDGAYDFFAMAYPLLQEFGFHATLYQTTFYSSFQRPVFDTIASYLLWKGRGKAVTLPDELGGRQVVPLADSSRSELHLRLREHANAHGWTAMEKDEAAERLAEEIGVDYLEVRRRRLLHLMTPEEVAALDPKLIAVQLHTHRHRTPRNESLFVREVEENRRALAAIRPPGERLEHFCYPSGDHDPLFHPWLSRCGVVSATTCNPGLASRATPSLSLPRLIDTMHLSDRMFEGWLSGVASFLPRRRH